MIRHTITGSSPYVLHAPGKQEFLPRKDEIFRLYRYFPPTVNVPMDLTIVTFNNRSESLLEDSLGDAPLTVLGRDITDWSHHLKLGLLSDYLPKVETPYVMILDAFDVLVIRDLQDILDAFKGIGCRALFNGEVRDWPEDLNHEVRGFEQDLLGRGIARDYCKHLNAGMWLAETDFATTVVNKAKLIDPDTEHKYSEQARIKCCYPELYPDMLVDYDCRIFININRLNRQIEVPVLL